MRYLTADAVNWSQVLAPLTRTAGTAGALVIFAGVVRADATAEGTVRALVYEAYHEMAQLHLARIAAQVGQRWPGVRASLQHRYGRVVVGEVSLLVGAAAAHRDEAYAACRHIVEAIKHDAPIWKQTEFNDGTTSWRAGAFAAAQLLDVAQLQVADARV